MGGGTYVFVALFRIGEDWTGTRSDNNNNNIKYGGKERVSIPDDSKDGSGKVLENFPKDLALDDHVRIREKLSIIREYSLQKNNVIKALLSISKLESSCAEDVNLYDLIKGANVDYEKG